jgi:hypothetical protein
MANIDKIYNKADEIENSLNFPNPRVIDINNLHTEVQKNAEYVFRAYKQSAKLAFIVGQLEELKKQTRSRLINECIKDPSLCDPVAGKYTDKKAETYYRLHPEYIAVIDELLKAEFELGCMNGLKRSFEDRKWLLKEEVTLTMADYFTSTESNKTRAVMSQQQALLTLDDPEIQEAIKRGTSAKSMTKGYKKEATGPKVVKPAGSLRERKRTII